MHNFGVMIRRRKRDKEGFPLIITDKDLKTYRRDHDFIIKFGLTECEALTMKNCIDKGLLDIHRSTRISMKELVNNIFFGGE